MQYATCFNALYLILTHMLPSPRRSRQRVEQKGPLATRQPGVPAPCEYGRADGQWGTGHATGSAVLREPAGAQAYRRDIPEAEVQLLDTGHFALETHAEEIGRAICDFLQAKINAEVDAVVR